MLVAVTVLASITASQYPSIFAKYVGANLSYFKPLTVKYLNFAGTIILVGDCAAKASVQVD